MNKIDNRKDKAKRMLRNTPFINNCQKLGHRHPPENLRRWLNQIIKGEWSPGWETAWSATESRYDQYMESLS